MQIHYSTPFSIEKNIGLAYNQFMESIPDGEWVCIRDGDSMFMRPDWGKQIYDIINRNGNQYKLISCVTNRLRATHQLYGQRFSEEADIGEHLEIANSLHSRYYDYVEPTTTVAGLCLIFNKDTWKECKFKENSLRFDSEFSTSIRQKFGKSIGIAKGLYLFHLYRWGQKQPTEYIKHLINT